MKNLTKILSTVCTLALAFCAVGCAESTEFTPNAVASVDIAAQQIVISGETDLADDAILKVSVVSDSAAQQDYAISYVLSAGEDNVLLQEKLAGAYTTGETIDEVYLVVSDGTYQGAVDLSDEAAGSGYQLTVTLPFDEAVQPETVQTRYGASGEEMTGETTQTLSVLYADGEDFSTAVECVVQPELDALSAARDVLSTADEAISAVFTASYNEAMGPYEFSLEGDTYTVQLSTINLLFGSLPAASLDDGTTRTLLQDYRYNIEVICADYLDAAYATVYGEGMQAKFSFTFDSTSLTYAFERLSTGEWIDLSGNAL